MVLNPESVRKTTYLVAGILPATGFGMLSLFLITTPLLFWTAAAWIGIVGLIQAFNRQPYDAIHTQTALMLICGVAAMAPVTTVTLLNVPYQFERQDDYLSALTILGTVSPIIVALHFLYFQASLSMTFWLTTLGANSKPDRELNPTGPV